MLNRGFGTSLFNMLTKVRELFQALEPGFRTSLVDIISRETRNKVNIIDNFGNNLFKLVSKDENMKN